MRATVVIAVEGPVLVGSRGDLERRVAKSGPGPVVIDLTHAEYIDAVGVATLVDLAGRLHTEGRALALAAPGRALRRLLALTRLDARLAAFATVAEAIAAVEVGKGEDDP